MNDTVEQIQLLMFLMGYRQVKLSQGWLDYIDAEPDPDNPAHWEYLITDAKSTVYIDFEHFPKVYLQALHKDIVLATIRYKEKLGVQGFIEDLESEIKDINGEE